MTRSTPSISFSGNMTPTSTMTMSRSYSITIMLRPSAPRPPRGIHRRRGGMGGFRGRRGSRSVGLLGLHYRWGKRGGDQGDATGGIVPGATTRDADGAPTGRRRGADGENG